MASEPPYSGLDLGTSQVKALLCAPDGTVLGQGTAGYEVAAPRPGWAEASPGALVAGRVHRGPGGGRSRVG